MDKPIFQNKAPNGNEAATPSWARADKDAVGTTASGASPVWYTVAGGILTEVFYPDVDTPQIRDFQLIITDGASFFHDFQRDFTHETTYPDPQATAVRITSKAIGKNYQVVQDIITEPDAPCLLLRTKLIGDPAFLQTLHVYALLAPHLARTGFNNSGYSVVTNEGTRLIASNDVYGLALGADCDFAMTACGFVAVNDGWTDIVGNRRLPIWRFDAAENGNIALTGELNLRDKREFVLALAFCTMDGATIASDRALPQGAALTAVTEALAYPFDDPAASYAHYQAFVQGWKSRSGGQYVPPANATGDGGRLFEVSRNVLLAHEDKPHGGALVASLSVPWGVRAQDDDAGYHLVWPRDMTQSATALLAAGEIDLPLRALMFLSQAQFQNGRLPQNFFIDGRYFRNADQLDEYSFPIILAYHMAQANALQGFDPKEMALGAAGAIIIHGPMTQQERWEENEGYSPSTLASSIAALICAADLALNRWGDPVTAQFLEEHADFLESNLEKWCVTKTGTLVPGIPQYYIRMLPTNVKNGGGQPSLPENPDTASITIGNHDIRTPQPANSVVDGGFLELVRYGIRPANDHIVVNSVKVIDAILRKNLAGGPAYFRYNNDGYGQKANGDPYDGTGLGHPWPLLGGERGHYELAAGGNALPYVKALENFAGTRGLLPEQLWDLPDLNTANPPLKQGGATGSAMPLAWAHAEYLKLVRSVADGRVFDRLAPVANRYLVNHQPSNLEVWNFDRQPLSIKAGLTLRLPLGGNFTLRWSKDNWASFTDTVATATKVGVFYVDLPTQPAQSGGNLNFDIQWLPSQQWVGGKFRVQLMP